ncbi:MAG: pilus assembly protein [Phycisphaerales bacterium]|nr:MAG: pilus assembly protein [Phycisphaerales bacterium]
MRLHRCHHRARSERPADRRGGVLIEFALITLIGYIFIAALLTFGQYFYSAQVVQQAADIAARELSRTPLPANITFDDLLADPTNEFSQRIYSEDFLAIDVTTWANNPGGVTLLEHLDTLGIPIVNKALVPVMFIENVGGTTLLRYPGALIDRGGTFSVAVPQVLSINGAETIRWTRVLEEIRAPGEPSAFPLTSPQGGLVALRVNYPFQAGAMSAHRPNPGGPFEPTIGSPIEADDANVSVVGGGIPGGGTPVDPTGGAPAGTFAGIFGLGKQQARGLELRPYRRVVTAQSIFRREVFE